MLLAVPVVHCRQHLGALMHRDDGALGEHREVLVGYDRGDFDDEIGVGRQARHLEIDPNQILGRFHCPHGSRGRQLSGSSGSGIVLASYGRGALVQSGEETLHCALKGRKQRIVCGDRVRWASGAADGGADASIRSSRAAICSSASMRGAAPSRSPPTSTGWPWCVACEPLPDWFLVDRYWAGARLKDIEALLIVNKSDLSCGGSRRRSSRNYRSLGLPCSRCRRAPAPASRSCAAALEGTATLLVGQSGVGKSSLVNALAPDAAAQTAELTREVEGRHTTTTARRYRLSPAPQNRAGSSMRRGCAISRPRQASRAPPSAASSRFTSAPPIAASAIAGIWRSRAARCATPCQRPRDRRAPLRKLPPAVPAVREARALAQETRVRPASACASVPPSTYSSSPPTGTPCAMREALRPRRSASSPR